MRFIIIAMVMILGLASGCGVSLYEYTDIDRKGHINNVRVLDVWTTNNFTEGESEELLEAVREWNEVLNGQMELRIAGTVSSEDIDEWDKKFKEIGSSRDGWLLIKLSSEHPLISRRVRRGTLAFVPGLGSSLMFIIEDHIGTKNLKTILMHEMGHMLGADHVNIDYTLMTPGYGPKQPDCIDILTAKQVAWYRELDFKGMNYCVVPE